MQMQQVQLVSKILYASFVTKGVTKIRKDVSCTKSGKTVILTILRLVRYYEQNTRNLSMIPQLGQYGNLPSFLGVVKGNF